MLIPSWSLPEHVMKHMIIKVFKLLIFADGYKKNDNLLFVNKCKIISFLSCKFSENEYNNLHKQRREEVQK